MYLLTTKITAEWLRLFCKNSLSIMSMNFKNSKPPRTPRFLAGIRPTFIDALRTVSGKTTQKTSNSCRYCNIGSMQKNRRALLLIFQCYGYHQQDKERSSMSFPDQPRGCRVHGFKHPSSEELDPQLPMAAYTVAGPAGRMSIFNRSPLRKCTDHPKYIPNIYWRKTCRIFIPVEDVDTDFWETRYRQINNFERTVSENGTVILRFSSTSQKEQKRRFLSPRIKTPDKKRRVRC